MDWMPIESAPKDDRELLFWIPTAYQGKGAWRVGMWCNFTDRPGFYGQGLVPIAGATHWTYPPTPPAPDGGAHVPPNTEQEG